MKNKETFVVNNVELAVIKPSQKDLIEAQSEYNKTFSSAISSGAVVRAQVDKIMKERNLWDDNKQKEFDRLSNLINNNEKVLAKGGIKLSEAKETAIQVRKDRLELQELISYRNSLNSNTAESQAENSKFNYLLYVCVVYNETGKKYFDSYADFIEKQNSDVAIEAATILTTMLYGLDKDFEKQFPENKFLLKYNFVDDKLRLINKEGKLVDADGRLIDENGRWINENGQFVDKNGNLITEKGEYIVDFQPFLDDDGNPVG